MSEKRCGECPRCIGLEVLYLEIIEEYLWDESKGDLTLYLNSMSLWIDHLVENGIPS